jgi:hypothetical protein
MNTEWSKWLRFPDPRKLELLIAPFGPGCYELRHGTQLVLFGQGQNVASRMSSLLPAPFGCGTRNNQSKRKYVFAHLGEVEYRTLACASAADADRREKELKGNGSRYLFRT